MEGHYGELTRPDCRCTIVQKSHEYLPQEKTPNKTDFHGNGVLIIRNPYKAIISHKNFKDSHSHVKLVEEDHFKGPGNGTGEIRVKCNITHAWKYKSLLDFVNRCSVGQNGTSTFSPNCGTGDSWLSSGSGRCKRAE